MATTLILANGREWPSCDEALRHFETMLDRYKDGESVEDAADVDDLTALFVRYENWLLRRLPATKREEVVSFTRQVVIGDQGSHAAFFFHWPNGASGEFRIQEALLKPWSSQAAELSTHQKKRPQ